MLSPIDFSITKTADLLPRRIMLAIESAAKTCCFAKGTVIERFGDSADRLSIIQSGMVRLGRNDADGSRFNLSLLGPGSSFGETALFLKLPVQYDALCETDVNLLSLTDKQVWQMARNEPDFGVAFIKLAHARSYAMLEHMTNTMSLPLPNRVGRLLLNMVNDAPDRKTVYCRQIDLGHALGVSRVSMGKALKLLEKCDLIKLAYGKILISSPTRLQTWLEQNQ